MNYYMGVDGGGSKTYAMIVDERGIVVGAGRSGNGNHQLGAAAAKRNVTEAVEAALRGAGVHREEIAYAFFGLAGADREADYRILRPMIADLGFPRHGIDCDTMIALRAGTSRPHGVVLICGTGVNGAGRNAAGDFYQCGGFSYLMGDYGGGADLRVEAFRAVIRAWDGREEPTLLTDLVLERLGYATVDGMRDDYLDRALVPPLDLVKLLFRAAAAGDGVAKRILRTQGEELGKTATAVIRRLGMQDDSFDVVLAGSILSRGDGDDVIAPIRESVQAAAPRANAVRLRTEPVVGAVWMAFEAGGGGLPPIVYERLRDVHEFEKLQGKDGIGT